MGASPIALEDLTSPIPRQLSVTFELKIQTRVTPTLEGTKTSIQRETRKKVA